ncbi:MAG TPA: TIM barrel protein [Candidatus Mediterraneibacter merdipullorum]|nr:TIM barrel protein [Candidatus Mediterraneibacter merdipullorum]
MRKLSFDQFGVMSVGYQQYSLEYTLDSIAESGLKYVDFWGGAPHYCAFDTPPEKRQEKVLAIRKMLDDRGLKMSVFTAEQICLYPINVASDNEYVRKNSIRIVKEYIEDTKAFGAKYFFPQMGYCMFDGDRDSAYGRSVEALKEIAAYAEKLGVKMVMEQLQMYESNLCYDRQTLKYLIDEVDSPCLTACVDCVAAASAGESIEDYYDTFGRIDHVHLADGNPAGHMVPGDGSNPLEHYLETLIGHGFDGSITLEINNQIYFDDPDTATKRAAEWLRKCPLIESTPADAAHR